MSEARALLLLSGGVDSIAAARKIQTDGALTACITFDYGQPANYEETLTSARWCRENGVEHFIRTVELDAAELARGDSEAPRVVPGRNAALLAVAVNAAATAGCNVVVIGATAGDAAAYPDCREEFLRALSGVFRLTYGVRVLAPLIGTDKAAAVSLLTAEDRAASFSCYTPAGRMRHCGRCRSCIERAVALASK